VRFELIDAELERDADRIVTVKSVTTAEEYLGDHFPTFPVLPGVMMVEALVQAARRLLNAESQGVRWVLAEVRNVRYGNMVRPGQQLRVDVERKKSDGDRHTFQGRGTVNDEAAVTGRFVMRPMRTA